MPTVPPLDPIVNYTEVPSDESVHGVNSISDHRMVETLFTAIEQIERENVEKAVIIEIFHVSKITTDAEKIALDALPIKEQILVLLSSVGQEAEVTVALNSMEITLSDNALALIDEIRQRLENVSIEEKAAFEEILKSVFSIETVEIDGVAYDFFAIDLLVKVDGAAHIERYGFRLDENNEWIFTQLSIGTFAE